MHRPLFSDAALTPRDVVPLGNVVKIFMHAQILIFSMPLQCSLNVELAVLRCMLYVLFVPFHAVLGCARRG